MSAFALFTLGFILFALALVFMGAEMFVPTHGTLAGIAALFALGGVFAMFKANSTAGGIAMLLVACAAPVAFYYYLKVYPNTAVGRRVILARPKEAEADARAQFLASLAGRDGTAVTPLRPAGTVEIDGRRIDCVAESEIIESGSRVRVQRVNGMKVVVVKI